MARAPMDSLAISELREFASFSESEQLFIQRRLAALRASSRMQSRGLWERLAAFAESEDEQSDPARYADLRPLIPLATERSDYGEFLSRLIVISVEDLSENGLESFSAYRFLYERLLGARARPWLPSAFCAAAAAPQMAPDRRKGLLHSLSESAATAVAWSEAEPRFYPEELDAA
ncbi:hypothetical protein [Altericroceibacterium endophyticum]|uniref:Uncharacterized protein n=1 Tax=Altericroceibacterium endophyticum TaxID=1808508 RepID=A0A6I4T6Z6_9SPHN|nr:hypothetical protein [Altericroceibacterium endophyticum]MXO65605.1 hypothetical protein [Altericroceibacterium endophyticum]